MKSETHYGKDADVMFGTSLKGYITTTRSRIETIFGKPSFDGVGSEDKVTTEWVVTIEDGEETFVATIYDWKRYEMGQPSMDELIVWNIGGNTTEARDKVAELLEAPSYGTYPLWFRY